MQKEDEMVVKPTKKTNNTLIIILVTLGILLIIILITGYLIYVYYSGEREEGSSVSNETNTTQNPTPPINTTTPPTNTTNTTNIISTTTSGGSSGGGDYNSGGGSDDEEGSCVPLTCSEIDRCGTFEDRCDGTITCGCKSGYECSEGLCFPITENYIFVDQLLGADCKGNYSLADRNCEGDDGDSYDTIQEALNVVSPGEKIIVLGDVDRSSVNAIYNVTCNGMNLINAGTSENRITVEAYNNHYVKIHGTGGGGCDGIEFDGGGANFYTIRGFHFDNFNKGAEGSVTIRKEGLVIEDCEFSNFADRGLILRNVHDSVFRDLYIHHSYEAGFIGYTLCNNLTLINVESSYNDDGKGSDGDADGFAFSAGNGNITMINCTAINNGEDGLDIAGENVKLINFYTSGGNACGIKLWRRAGDIMTNYTLINVIVRDYNEAGIKITGGSASPAGEYHVQIYNSLFYDNGEQGIIFNFGREDINSKAEVYNTIFINNGYYDPNDNSCCYPAYYVSSSASPYWDIMSDYNLFYDNWDGDVAWGGEGAHSLLGVNPELFAPDIGDFHLKGNSPAIDSGLSISMANTDFEGRTRPIDGNSDGILITDRGPFESYQNPGNQGPSFSYSGTTNFVVYESEKLEVNFPATDPDNDELRYLILGGDILPEMDIDNSGKFSFTPDNNRANSSEPEIYNLNLGVTDEYYYYPPDELNISIKVLDVNRPPVYEGLNYYSFIEGRKGRIKLPVNDLDGDRNISSILTNAPASLDYNDSTYIIDWTPLSGDVGTYKTELNISDGVDISNYTIILEVLPEEPYQEPTNEANIFYVDGVDGDDNNNGQTETSAWKTIQKAKNTLTAGQMVLIREGTYNEYGSIYNSGSPDSPIIFKAYPGEEVIMDGTGWSSPEAFNIYSSNLVIDGLTFFNFSETLFVRTVCENITLINLKFIGARIYGLQDWGIQNNLRIENVMMDNIGDRGLNLGSVKNVHIHNLTIRDFEDRGISIRGSSADNINIINSKIYDSKENGYFSILVNGKNAYIEGVTILNTSGIATYFYPDYLYMINSVISDTQYRGSNSFQILLGDREGKKTEAELYNNIIYNGKNYGVYIRDDVTNTKLKNNIIYDNAIEIRLPTDSIVDEDYNIFRAGFASTGSHSFNADPLFVDADNHNFSLQETSPAIDAGIDIGLPYSGNAPDIGAYETEYIGSENAQTEASSLSIWSWFKGLLTGKTIKAITGNYLNL